MKITNIRIARFSLPLDEPFKIAIGTLHEAPNLLVRIETDSGQVGWGEGGPFPPITGETQAGAASVARDYAGMLMQRDPSAVEALAHALRAANPGNPSVRCAFDMALWDLRAHVCGLPLHRLLGAAEGRIATDQTVPMHARDVMIAKARDAVERGVRALKLKVGGPDLVAEVELVSAVRRAIGPSIALRLDANQGWDVPTADRALKAFAACDVQFVEQPVKRQDLAGLAWLRARSPIPLVADEACFDSQDAFALLRLDACDHLNIKLAKAGGITEALAIARTAQAAHMTCMVGCMLESRLGIGASAAVAAACPNVRFADLDGFTFHAVDPVEGGLRAEPGWIHLPEAPGLGATISDAFLDGLESEVLT